MVTAAQRTILEDSFNVESIGGAGFEVGASIEVRSEFSSSGVIDDSRVALGDGVLGTDEDDGDVMGGGGDVVEVGHLGKEAVHRVEAQLVFKTEHKYHRVYPLGELGGGGGGW